MQLFFKNALDAHPKMNASTFAKATADKSVPSPPSAKPRFRLRHRNGQLLLIIGLPVEPADVHQVQRQLTRGVIAALLYRHLNPPNPKAP